MGRFHHNAMAICQCNFCKFSTLAAVIAFISPSPAVGRSATGPGVHNAGFEGSYIHSENPDITEAINCFSSEWTFTTSGPYATCCGPRDPCTFLTMCSGTTGVDFAGDVTYCTGKDICRTMVISDASRNGAEPLTQYFCSDVWAASTIFRNDLVATTTSSSSSSRPSSRFSVISTTTSSIVATFTTSLTTPFTATAASTGTPAAAQATESSSASPGWIVGVVIGSLLGVALLAGLIAGLAYWFGKRHGKPRPADDSGGAEQSFISALSSSSRNLVSSMSSGRLTGHSGNSLKPYDEYGPGWSQSTSTTVSAGGTNPYELHEVTGYGELEAGQVRGRGELDAAPTGYGSR
ncbi:hypothetical protein B0T22DRAFT_139218 [Podospora appendiculata]|uniref:Mid2 domain-containing protein n=1 Tax=Podospora appendiculata TaxID=314037 RepID=A0AAE0X8U9_9PEZI|nr:hypothetical protein B0T22DRAFT_139218 [Podospora appendiculata]